MKVSVSLVAAFFLVASSTGYADPLSDQARRRAEKICSESLDTGAHNFFPGMTRMAKDVRTRYCSFDLTQVADLQNAILDVLIDSESEFKSLAALNRFNYTGLVNAAESSALELQSKSV